MISSIEGLPDGVDGLQAGGLITRHDYETVVVPLLDRAAAGGRRLRVLCILDSGFEGVSPDAVWEDVTLGLRALPLFERCAVVTDLPAVRTACRVAAVLVPYSLRVFDQDQYDGAVDWLAAEADAGFDVELREPEGVAVVRADRPLRRSDFDVLGREIDGWFAEHAELTGLVVSAPAFPGWENLPGALRHAAFVLQRQRRIRRIALAVDGLPDLAPVVAGTVLHPEVRRFRHADVDAAVDWAAAPVPAGR